MGDEADVARKRRAEPSETEDDHDKSSVSSLTTPQSAKRANHRHDTQSPVDTEKLQKYCASQRRRHVWGQLRSLCSDLDPVDLSDDRFVFGRGEDGRPVDYSFERLRAHQPELRNMISNVHFQIERVFTCGSQFRVLLTDTSMNGTFVNGARVARDASIYLNNNDLISIAVESFPAWVWAQDGADEEFPSKLTNKYIATSCILGRGRWGTVCMGFRQELSQSTASQPGPPTPHTSLERVAIKKMSLHNLSRRFTADSDGAGSSSSEQNDAASTASRVKAVNNEVSTMLRLDHPNCIHFYDWFSDGNCAYIVMECVRGGELFYRIVDPIRQNNGLGESLTKFYSWQLLSALEYLHSTGTTHRDLKPENILLVEDEDYTVVKIADFGLAKCRDQSTMNTFCGTPAYIAPEMLETDSPYTAAVDMWALGVVIFTAIVGYPPFPDGRNDHKLTQHIKEGRLNFIEERWKNITPSAKDLIVSMLQVDPKSRPTPTKALASPWMSAEGDEAVARSKEVVAKYVSSRLLL